MSERSCTVDSHCRQDATRTGGLQEPALDYDPPMATAEQLKALMRSYAEGDGTRFLSIAMQMAAQEARQGHQKLAQELRALIDLAKERGVVAPQQPTRPALL